MLNFNRFKSLMSLINYFKDEMTCKRFIKEQRWGEVVVCPYCGSVHVYTCKGLRFKCKECKNTFSVKVGTIFEDSNISLRKWFIAMYLISSHKKGISSCQLARDLAVTQKTAWYILHKVRTLYAQDDAKALCGEVEMDEMYLGGREKNKHASKKVKGTQGRSTKTKKPIFGMIQRGGEAKVIMVDDTKANTLMPIIKQFVKDNSHLFTDELVSYKGLGEMGYTHDIVHHAANEYVNGMASTNAIEGFWGHFKRSIFGIYHFVSVKHLQAYIDEMVFRWNTRKASESNRFEIMLSRSLCNVTYKDVRGTNSHDMDYIMEYLNSRASLNNIKVVA